ncbi:uncharacterized protein CBL_10536 [Carabus blaptoides fortunei]
MSETEKSKRRKRGEGSWQISRKKLRTSGEAYTTKTNKMVDAKKPPSAHITCKCKYMCRDITQEHKTNLFDASKQNTFLMGLINPCPISRRRKGVNPNESHKQTSVSFSIPNGSGNILKICKKMFTNVFAVTKRRIETLVMRLKLGLFIDICAGFPGSVHDSCVLRHSNLYRRANYPPRAYFIIGDSGYPCRSQPVTIITPHRDPATQLHRAFNHSLGSARIIVERSFGMIKTRWGSIFTKALDVKIEKSCKVIVACTMMHNICVSQGDISHVQIEEPRNRQQARNQQGGEDHRNLLLRMFAIENGFN